MQNGFLAVAFLVSVTPVFAENLPALEAAAVRLDITPPTGHPMWGYAARHADSSRAVRDPLLARVLVLGDGKQRVAIVSLDLGRAPTRDSTERIRQAVRKFDIMEVFLCGSHTHHGPVLELDDWPTKQKPYVRQLEAQLIEAIEKAARERQPCRMGLAARDGSWNRNRHSKRADRQTDPQLTVLRWETLDGKPLAHAVHLAAHPTLLPVNLMKFSADYPGPLTAALEKEWGVPCLFLQGAAGDLSPNPPGENRSPESYGKWLATEASALLKTVNCKVSASPEVAARRDEWKLVPAYNVTNPIIRRQLEKAFFPELVHFYEREYRETVRPVVTTALIDNRLGLVGVSGELFSGHALSLRRRARLEQALILGYCNDHHLYFPTIEAAAEGGYGAGPPMAITPVGTGEAMIDKALIRLYQMRGKLPE